MLGIAFAFLTLGFAALAWSTRDPEGMRTATIGELVLGVFCAVGAMACFLSASRPITLRLIGGVVFLVCVGYLIEMAVSGPVLARPRSEMSLVGSIAAFSIFGSPAGYVAVMGR